MASNWTGSLRTVRDCGIASLNECQTLKNDLERLAWRFFSHRSKHSLEVQAVQKRLQDFTTKFSEGMRTEGSKFFYATKHWEQSPTRSCSILVDFKAFLDTITQEATKLTRFVESNIGDYLKRRASYQTELDSLIIDIRQAREVSQRIGQECMTARAAIARLDKEIKRYAASETTNRQTAAVSGVLAAVSLGTGIVFAPLTFGVSLLLTAPATAAATGMAIGMNEMAEQCKRQRHTRMNALLKAQQQLECQKLQLHRLGKARELKQAKLETIGVALEDLFELKRFLVTLSRSLVAGKKTMMAMTEQSQSIRRGLETVDFRSRTSTTSHFLSSTNQKVQVRWDDMSHFLKIAVGFTDSDSYKLY